MDVNFRRQILINRGQFFTTVHDTHGTMEKQDYC